MNIRSLKVKRLLRVLVLWYNRTMKKDNEALKEVGKGFIAFANLFTALSVINFYLKADHIDILSVVLSAYAFAALYIAGYKLIKRGQS